MGLSKIEIIDGELGIAACDKDVIPQDVIGNLNKDEITVFYCYKRDWFVLNKGHKYHKFYKDILKEYLEMSDYQRARVNEYVKEKGITFFDFINKALRIRRKRYQLMKKTA